MKDFGIFYTVSSRNFYTVLSKQFSAILNYNMLRITCKSYTHFLSHLDICMYFVVKFLNIKFSNPQLQL